MNGQSLFYSHDLNRGFLPRQNPRQQFLICNKLHSQLCAIANDLPQLLSQKALRAKINQLNDAELISELNIEEEKHFAFLLLLMLTQAYIWEDPENPCAKIPAVLAKNIVLLSKRAQRLPTLTYADYILHNWKVIDPTQGFMLHNIEPIFSFTGSPDEAWFIKVHVAIEANCGAALNAIYEACIMPQNDQCLLDALKAMRTGLTQAIDFLAKMKEGCRPGYYWLTIRPYLKGWENVKDLTFEGLNPSYNIDAYTGASGAQSSIIPALDAFLGIRHAASKDLLLNLYFRYMPKTHQALIHFFRENSVDKIVSASSSEELKIAFTDAVRYLKLFRLAHVGLVSQYLLKPAEKLGISPHKVIGTGGTLVTDYLSERCRTTVSRL